MTDKHMAILKTEGTVAASAFVAAHFPDALAALLAGSVARGETTPRSDLDILIIAPGHIKPYREAFREYGWFIEAFVETRQSCEEKIKRPQTNSNPSFLTVCDEGIILKDSEDFARNLKATASILLRKGPDPLTPLDISKYRYFITDLLDKFIDASEQAVASFLVYDLLAKASELTLAYHRVWIAERKWLYRWLCRFDQEVAERFVNALKSFHRTGQIDEVVSYVEDALGLVGGRLYEGYRVEAGVVIKPDW